MFRSMTSSATSSSRFSRCTASGVRSRRAPVCRCSAGARPLEQQRRPQTQPQRLAAGCLAALASAAAVLSPWAQPPASLAVSGGGGSSQALSFQDLSGQDLTRRRFTKGEMRQTKFDGAKLAGVSMFGALAEKASFVGADLSGADLESGNFDYADFTNANLTAALFTNTQVKGVKIEGADFTDVLLRRDVQLYLCGLPTAKGTNPTTGVDTRESLLCE